MKWTAAGRGVPRGFPLLNWAHSRAVCPRFWPGGEAFEEVGSCRGLKTFKSLGSSGISKGEESLGQVQLGAACLLFSFPTWESTQTPLNLSARSSPTLTSR